MKATSNIECLQAVPVLLATPLFTRGRHIGQLRMFDLADLCTQRDFSLLLKLSLVRQMCKWLHYGVTISQY